MANTPYEGARITSQQSLLESGWQAFRRGDVLGFFKIRKALRTTPGTPRKGVRVTSEDGTRETILGYPGRGLRAQVRSLKETQCAYDLLDETFFPKHD